MGSNCSCLGCSKILRNPSSAGWEAGWLAGWVAGWVAGCVAGCYLQLATPNGKQLLLLELLKNTQKSKPCMAGWLAGWVAGWVAGWLAGWLGGWLWWLGGWVAGSACLALLLSVLSVLEASTDRFAP